MCEGNFEDHLTSLRNIQNNKMMNHSSEQIRFCIDRFARFYFCIGTDVVATVDSTRTGIQSIYHINCEVLVSKSQAPARCTPCKKHRKSLQTMALRCDKDDRVDPSSHTAYSCLSTSEKDERLHRLHTKYKMSRLQIVRLQKKISESIEQGGLKLDEELSKDMQQIFTDNTMKIQNFYQPESFQCLFWDQQMKALYLTDKRSMRWHPLIIKWCLYLRHLSGKAYETLRQCGVLRLPSQRTLRDYTHYSTTTIGFSFEIDQHLVDVADLSKDLNKYVILVIDEIHIKEELVYDKHEGCLIGFVNLGETNNQLLEFESALSESNSRPTLPSTMLVIMVRGIFCKLNYPYAQFGCSNLTGDQLFDPVWQAIGRLEKLGFYVLVLTCDGASPNRRLWKLHSKKKKEEMVYKVPNPYAVDRELYFISDPPHLLKTIRNCWYNSKRKLWVSNIVLHFRLSNNFLLVQW